MTNPFDYVNEIMQTKKNLMRGSENDKLAEDGYNPWLANLALSYHQDTILIANLANINHHLSKRPSFELLLNTVRPKKRQFRKWAKPTADEDLDVVCETYGCNRRIGQQYLSLLSSDQIESLKRDRRKGGTKDERN